MTVCVCVRVSCVGGRVSWARKQGWAGYWLGSVKIGVVAWPIRLVDLPDSTWDLCSEPRRKGKLFIAFATYKLQIYSGSYSRLVKTHIKIVFLWSDH